MLLITVVPAVPPNTPVPETFVSFIPTERPAVEVIPVIVVVANDAVIDPANPVAEEVNEAAVIVAVFPVEEGLTNTVGVPAVVEFT